MDKEKLLKGLSQFHLQGLPENVKAAVAAKIPQCDPASKIEKCGFENSLCHQIHEGI